MQNHGAVIVPVESWAYHSPDLKLAGKDIDIGLMAEAMIYYDQVYVNPANPQHFASLISWFIEQRKFSELIDLFDEGVLGVFEYSFISPAIKTPEGKYILLNIEDEEQQVKGSFETRYLYDPSIEKIVLRSRDREKLYKVLRGKVIEAKAAEYGVAVNHAREGFNDPDRSAISIQVLLDELYPKLGLGTPPRVKVEVKKNGVDTTHTYNINFNPLMQQFGNKIGFHQGSPIAAMGVCNRLLLASANLQSDLYLGSPMSMLAGNKLYEAGRKIIKTGQIIDDLKEEVEFPDIKGLVNNNKLKLEDILLLRKKAKRFREWLQQEGERDRNAIIAYHNEVAKESGFTKANRKVIRMFGMISGTLIGLAVAQNIGGQEGIVSGSLAGKGVDYLTSLATKIGEGWRPVVFGNWLQSEIQKIVKEN